MKPVFTSKRFTLSLVSTLLFAFVSSSIIAAPVQPQRALQLASEFLPQNSAIKKVKGKTAPESRMELVYTHKMPKSGNAAIYVVSLGETGFVLVSADDIANPILGYSFTNPWPSAAAGDTLPPQVSKFLGDLAMQIEAAIEAGVTTAYAAQKAPRKAVSADSTLPDSVGPLLTTTWDQGMYYNRLCPQDENGPDGHVYTGCVATAMAQLINYWGQKQPIKTRGIHSYESPYGKLEVDYYNTSYDFAHMPDRLTSESTDEEINAVAKLMYDCGIAVNMQYGAEESGAYDFLARTALVNNYTFSPDLGMATRSLYSDIEWDNLLQTNINKGMPVLYSSGSLIAGGHFYILDGYANNYYHINFGWGGNADGWYSLSVIEPLPAYKFIYNQQSIVDIEPIKESNIIYYAQGHTIYSVNNPVDIYNTFGHNTQSIALNYDNLYDTLTLSSTNKNVQLVLDILTLNEDIIDIYDGNNTEKLLRSLSYETQDNDLSPIVSSLRAFTIVFRNLLSRKDVHLRISDDSSCRVVSEIQATLNGSNINLSWQENGASKSWKIEYGLSGFMSGKGTTLIANTNSITIPDIDNSLAYDIKIQPICDTIYNEKINTVTVNKKTYWTDVVTSEPEGYYVDDKGTIHVSTAEGLAWIAKLSLDDTNWEEWLKYIDRKISIDDDIDLAGYYWEPIKWWRGVLDGNGYSIDNMHAVPRLMTNSGFFAEYSGDTIQNIGFKNAIIEGCSDCGTIAGIQQGYSVIINCYSTNFRIISFENGGSQNAGGFFGFGAGEIMNSYVIGDIRASFMGGFVGWGYSSLYNCFSSVRQFDSNLQSAWRGLLICGGEEVSYSNCYADIDYTNDYWNYLHIWNDLMGGLYNTSDLIKLYFFGTAQNMYLQNISGFTREQSSNANLITDFSLSCQYDNNTELLTALNEGVINRNSPLLRTWVNDSITGLPIFGGYYHPKCINVSDITVKNISFADSVACEIQWRENGYANQWQIKVEESESPENSNIYFVSNTTKYIITDICQLGKEYNIYVRPICDEDENLYWSEPVPHLYDKLYWVDIVKEQPHGYVVDEVGNVKIYTPEALVWLSVCSNGLNGQEERNFYGDTIEIMANLNMSGYKWTPIGDHRDELANSRRAFMGTLLGHNHIISNIYCNERVGVHGSNFDLGFNNTHLGLIGGANTAIIKDIVITNSYIKGYYDIGAIVGEAINCHIKNCHVNQSYLEGIMYVGSLFGRQNQFGKDFNGENYKEQSSQVSNCSACNTTIIGDKEIGGLCGSFGEGELYNSYSNCYLRKLNKRNGELIGGFCGAFDGKMRNCYSTSSMADVNDNSNYFGLPPGLFVGAFSVMSDISNIYTLKSDKMYWFGAIGGILDSTFVLPVMSYISTINDSLDNEVVINEKEYCTFLDALNAWVNAQDNPSQYLHWAADTANVNGGFPVFANESTKKYVVTFMNEGVILQQDTLEFGELPLYIGDTPTKSADNQYAYTFAGWLPEIVPVTSDATYTANFVKELTGVENINDQDAVYENGTIHNLSGKTIYVYSATGQLVNYTTGDINLNAFNRGMYLITNGNWAVTFVKY